MTSACTCVCAMRPVIVVTHVFLISSVTLNADVLAHVQLSMGSDVV